LLDQAEVERFDQHDRRKGGRPRKPEKHCRMR
jgi:hypothetical protein